MRAEYEQPTEYGDVLVTPTSLNQIRVSAGSNGRHDLTIRGVAYCASLFLVRGRDAVECGYTEEEAESWQPYRRKPYHGVNVSRRDSRVPSEAGRRDTRKALINAGLAWLDNDYADAALAHAEKETARQERDRTEVEVQEAAEALAAVQGKAKAAVHRYRRAERLLAAAERGHEHVTK